MRQACPVCGRVRPCPAHPARTRNGSTRAWRTTRAAILQRDHGICHICHQPGAGTVDHLDAHAYGGTDHPSNLAAAHQHCNSARGATTITNKEH